MTADGSKMYVGKLFTIFEIDPDGTHRVLVSATDPHAIRAPIYEPFGLARDGDLLYVLDVQYSQALEATAITLRRIDLRTRRHTALATWLAPKTSSLGWPTPHGLAVAADGTLWIAQPRGGISRFDPRTLVDTPVLAAPPSSRGLTIGRTPQVTRPSRPVVAPGGELYFVDEGAVLRWQR